MIPDGHGYVYHRAGCFGPGRIPLADTEQMRVEGDLNGDRAMTERFIREVLLERRPALGVGLARRSRCNATQSPAGLH